MKRRLFNVAVALSLALCAATAACWVVGAVHPTAWPCRAAPLRTWFVRFERQHLIVSYQQMVPKSLPADCAADSSRFREYGLSGPQLPEGEFGLEMDPRHWAVHPSGAWFRIVRTPAGGFVFTDAAGARYVDVHCFFGTVEVPWWSLMLVVSVVPAYWLLARLRLRSRRRRRLCGACGYDLRASPQRCPECGAVPEIAASRQPT